jgi:dTDP-4-amino-4,6-dideoxygalactose transaminase
MAELLAQGISTRRGIMNAHQEGAYADLAPAELPHSEAARDAVILLPLYAGMTEQEQERVLGCLRAAAATREAVLLPG